MLDAAHILRQAAARCGGAEALVDGDRRWTYRALLDEAERLAGGIAGLGLAPGDRLASILRNRAEAALLHWACQLAGVTITPLNWRLTADELDYCLENSEAKAVFFESASAEAVQGSPSAATLPRIDVDADFAGLAAAEPASASGSMAETISVMLYTSGTTGRPKGVPRRHRAERAAAIAHVAQNQYGRGERTLGVMPLYHTMGVRSLLASALVDGCFICQPRFDAGGALALIEAERITNLYLVPTLYHDVLAHPDFARTDVSSVRKLGFAGASMTDGLLRRLQAAFRPDLFVNHYGSSEIYTFAIEPDAPAKPGSAGRAGLNQTIKVAKLGGGAGDPADVGEEGEIIADLAGDEAFEGYWRRPDADAKALRDGWYHTGDTGFFDADGDLFVTGRVDDMIITGGENVSPVEIESALSLHPAVAEIAVAGMPDERWGQIVVAFVKRASPVDAKTLDAHCVASGLARFKRPRRYEFVAEIPKSPVGKILRRLLQSGEYEKDPA